MAATAIVTQWACRERGCNEGGEGNAAEADKAAEQHTKKAGHATTCWSEPTLPIKVKENVSK